MRKSAKYLYQAALKHFFRFERCKARAVVACALKTPGLERHPIERARLLYVLAKMDFWNWPTVAGYRALSEVIGLCENLGAEGVLLHGAALEMLADFLETCRSFEFDLPHWAQVQPAPEALAEVAFDLRCRHLDTGHPSVAASHLRNGRHAEAIAVYESACGRQCLMLAEPLKKSMMACLEAGQVEEATAFADRLAAVLAHHFPELLPETHDDIAQMFSWHGHMQYAKQLLDRTLEQRLSSYGSGHPEVAASHIYLSGWSLRAGDYDACRRHGRKAIDILKATELSEDDSLSKSLLVDTMIDFFRPLGGCCEEVHRLLQLCDPIWPSPFDLDRPYHLIAWSFFRQGDKAAAIAAYQEGLAVLEAQPEPDPSSVRIFTNGIRRIKGEPLVL